MCEGRWEAAEGGLQLGGSSKNGFGCGRCGEEWNAVRSRSLVGGEVLGECEEQVQVLGWEAGIWVRWHWNYKGDLGSMQH